MNETFSMLNLLGSHFTVIFLAASLCFGCSSSPPIISSNEQDAIASHISMQALTADVIDAFKTINEDSTQISNKGNYAVKATVIEGWASDYLLLCYAWASDTNSRELSVVKYSLYYDYHEAKSEQRLKVKLHLSLFDLTNITTHSRIPDDVRRFVHVFWKGRELELLQLAKRSSTKVLSPLEPTFSAEFQVEKPSRIKNGDTIQILIGELEQIGTVTFEFKYPLPSSKPPEKVIAHFRNATQAVRSR